MLKKISIFFIILFVSLSINHISIAKDQDATLTLIYNPATSQSDMKRLIKEFEKEFGTVQPFDLKKNTNFYIYYYVTDENYVQFEMTRQDQENIIGRDLSSFTSDGFIGSAKYLAFKRRTMIDGRFSSGRRNITAKDIKKPYKSAMFLYDSYGSELIRIETKDFYKSESAALRGAIRTMRRAIKNEKEKMARPQTLRCLFCDYDQLIQEQKEKVDNLAFISHESQLNQLYGEIIKAELPVGLNPYANLYLSLEDFETLEHIFDVGAVNFKDQIGKRKLPGHLINELIALDASNQLLTKVAAAYQQSNFEEFDLNNNTPLWSAISLKNIELVQKLIDLGADVNQITQVNGSSLTPLILSAQLGNIETTEILLKNGAIKDLTTPSGQSAWSTAMWIGQYDHAAMLWPDNFTDPKSNNEASNFLIQAVYFGEREKASNLLSKGVPVTSSGQTGDNIAMSVVKGITTFTINKDITSPSSTKHRTTQSIYWQILEDAKMAGISDPINSTIDREEQTLLFHAYPESSEPINGQHIELFNRLIKSGIDPNAINVHGQNADDKFVKSRFDYFDELYKAQLEEINLERITALAEIQNKQKLALDAALNKVAKRQEKRSTSRARTQARRLEAINNSDDITTRELRMHMQNGNFVTSNFIRDTSDVDYKQNYSRAEIEATRQIQIEYSQELDQVNQTAAMQKQKLDDYIQSLKDEERKNALIRKELILNSSSDNTETLLY